MTDIDKTVCTQYYHQISLPKKQVAFEFLIATVWLLSKGKDKSSARIDANRIMIISLLPKTMVVTFIRSVKLQLFSWKRNNTLGWSPFYAGANPFRNPFSWFPFQQEIAWYHDTKITYRSGSREWDPWYFNPSLRVRSMCTPTFYDASMPVWMNVAPVDTLRLGIQIPNILIHWYHW